MDCVITWLTFVQCYRVWSWSWQMVFWCELQEHSGRMYPWYKDYPTNTGRWLLLFTLGWRSAYFSLLLTNTIKTWVCMSVMCEFYYTCNAFQYAKYVSRTIHVWQYTHIHIYIHVIYYAVCVHIFSRTSDKHRQFAHARVPFWQHTHFLSLTHSLHIHAHSLTDKLCADDDCRFHW